MQFVSRLSNLLIRYIVYHSSLNKADLDILPKGT